MQTEAQGQREAQLECWWSLDEAVIRGLLQ